MTAAGYVVSSAWLTSACPDNIPPAPPNTTSVGGVGGEAMGVEGVVSTSCPLPVWLTPDGVYHSSMAIAYILMACGTVVFTKPRAGTRAEQPLLSVQDEAGAASSSGGGGGGGLFWRCMQTLNAVTWYFMVDLPPHCAGSNFRVKHAINAHKLCCPVFVITVMCCYQTRALHAYIYLAMHGVYGLTWLVKDAAFPDQAWEASV